MNSRSSTLHATSLNINIQNKKCTVFAPRSTCSRRERLHLPLYNQASNTSVTAPSAAERTTTTTIPQPSENAEDRKYLSILPPFFSRATSVEALIPNKVWGFVQPLKPPGQPDIRLRMVVTRLDDGNLFLCGPIAPTPELIAMISSLGGNVTHIAIPNTSPEHFLFGPSLAAAYPTATVWTVPGFYDGKGVPLPGRSLLFNSTRQRNPCKTLGIDPFPSDLAGQIDTVVFDVPFFVEAAIILRKHKALLTADTAVCLSASDAEYSGMNEKSIAIARDQLGVWDRLGPITKVVFEKYNEEGKKWVEDVLDILNSIGNDMTPGVDDDIVVLPGHATAPVSNGREAFKNCFDFLYE